MATKKITTSAKGGSASGGKKMAKPKAVKTPSDASAIEATIYTQEGKKSGTVNLPENIFGLKWNADLVHQVVTSLTSSRRKGTAHAKDRGEVRGGGKKPWQQKGTGRARHGSTRSPIWRKGGVTHGPRNDKNYDRKVNNKMRVKALHVVLSQKFRDGEILFLNDLKMSKPMTKEAKIILDKLGTIKGFEAVPTRKKNALMLALSKKDSATEKSFKNFGNVHLTEARNLNVADLLNYRYLAVVNPEEYLKILK
ncbi:MAG: 50S ribosomal protein L4 [bacterium]|nr:50S ribosomal protein L4 [bacterium]